MPVYKAVILIAGPQKGTRSCLIHVKAPKKSHLTGFVPCPWMYLNHFSQWLGCLLCSTTLKHVARSGNWIEVFENE